VGVIAAVNAVLRLSVSCFVPKKFTIKVESCPKLDVFNASLAKFSFVQISNTDKNPEYIPCTELTWSNSRK